MGRLRNSSSRGSSTAASASGDLGTVDFSFDEICKGTGNFSASYKIGEGRFGTVYKAKLRDGSCVAIKRARKVNKCGEDVKQSRIRSSKWLLCVILGTG